MSDKPVAGITTAIIALPLVILCCLGPAFLFAGLGGLIGWLGGANIFLAVAMAIVAGIAVNRFLRRRVEEPRTSGAGNHTADQLGDETSEGVKNWPLASACCPAVPRETPATEPQPERSATGAAEKFRREHMAVPAFLRRSSNAPADKPKTTRVQQ